MSGPCGACCVHGRADTEIVRALAGARLLASVFTETDSAPFPPYVPEWGGGRARFLPVSSASSASGILLAEEQRLLLMRLAAAWRGVDPDADAWLVPALRVRIWTPSARPRELLVLHPVPAGVRRGKAPGARAVAARVVAAGQDVSPALWVLERAWGNAAVTPKELVGPVVTALEQART
ncbi:hypothetical protein BG418_01450 [Streptomyces sp. CBMA152]|nr:hypothetical protein [Streptomyces sp. CBMA152]